MLQPIGKFTVAAAGTPTRCTSTQSDPAEAFPCHGVLIQALSSNAGKVYIGTAAMNKSTLANVLAVLPVPTANSLPSFTAALTLAPNSVDLAKLYLDVDTNGEGALVSVLIA